MEEQPGTPRLIRYLPHMVVVTMMVAVCPMALAWWLTSQRVVGSAVVSVVAATAWSLGAAQIGGRYWRARPHGGDVLFADLMLWGWLRRLWSERRVRSALTLLEGVGGTASVREREQALLELAVALEVGDPYTSGHSRRVARHAERIAKALGLAPREVSKIRTAAALHDVGKVRTPKAILHKPARLSDEEFAVIRRHPADGAEMVAVLGDSELTAMIRHHHERLDGAGYPAGLAGEAIPLGARIIAVADTFDAITSVRSYRRARSHRKALAILDSEAGRQLDGDAVKAFQRYYAGARPLAVWVPFASIAQRLSSLLGGGVSAGATSMGRVALAAGVTSATAAAAVSLPAVPGTPGPRPGAAGGPKTEVAAVRGSSRQARVEPLAPAGSAAPSGRPGAPERVRARVVRAHGSSASPHAPAKPHAPAPAMRRPLFVSTPPAVSSTTGAVTSGPTTPAASSPPATATTPGSPGGTTAPSGSPAPGGSGNPQPPSPPAGPVGKTAGHGTPGTPQPGPGNGKPGKPQPGPGNGKPGKPQPGPGNGKPGKPQPGPGNGKPGKPHPGPGNGYVDPAQGPGGPGGPGKGAGSPGPGPGSPAGPGGPGKGKPAGPADPGPGKPAGPPGPGKGSPAGPGGPGKGNPGPPAGPGKGNGPAGSGNSAGGRPSAGSGSVSSTGPTSPKPHGKAH